LTLLLQSMSLISSKFMSWGDTLEQFEEVTSSRDIIKEKLRKHFDGRIVRKDLTKHIKEGANVPVYVLEFLLG